MYVLAAVVILLLILLFIPIRFLIEFHDGTDFEIKIGPFKKTILSKDKVDGKSKKKAKEKKQDNKKCDDESPVFKKIEKYRKLATDFKKDFFDIVAYLANHGAKFENLDFNLKFGFDDAAGVGMLYGLINAAAYSVMGVLHNNFTVKKWNLNIEPDYSDEIFDLKFGCILKTRSVHIIVMGIKFLKVFIKIKNK